MDIPFLKKYKPMIFADFFIEKLLIKLLKTLIKMDSLNMLLIGNSGSGKTSILDATIREYYGLKKNASETIFAELLKCSEKYEKIIKPYFSINNISKEDASFNYCFIWSGIDCRVWICYIKRS